MRAPLLVLLPVLLLAVPAPAQVAFRDSTAELGLDDVPSGNVKFADVNGDGRCDLITGDGRPDASKGPRGHRVFLNVVDEQAPAGFRFVEKADHNLPRGGSLAFADFDADGRLDCLYAPFLNVAVKGYRPPEGLPDGPALCFGNGDGSFGAPVRLSTIPPRPHHVIAVGDIDRDGRLDFWLGSSYRRAPWLVDDSTGVGAGSDLALQVAPGDGERVRFERVPLPDESGDFAKDPDSAPIPCYGGLIAALDGSARPSILELGYGRRVNRIWSRGNDRGWVDVAPSVGFDGDAIRHGRYPDWIKAYAKKTGRFGWVHEDSPPHRAHGNTFDAAITDVDNDGDFDLFVAQIRHGWAGDSSDPTGLWMRDGARFELRDPEGNVSRRPADPSIKSWNEGDLFCETADLDHDGLVDLILASGDYPDPQKLRVYRQLPGGRFVDVTRWSGLLDHDGCQLISLADLDHDGDLDLVAGQAFTRYSEAQKNGRAQPAIAVFLNRAGPRGKFASLFPRSDAIVLAFRGSDGVNPHGLGAIVRCETRVGDAVLRQTRQLVGIGGRGGKQREFAVHFGLAGAASAKVEIVVPDGKRTVLTLHDVKPGRRVVDLGR